FDLELAKHYKKAKQEFLYSKDFDGTRFLHRNAKKLIDDLAKAGVRTIIMDECHHLLDYWALIIKELIKRLDKPYLIGLTATPPDKEEGLDNYYEILGDVDFEVPTPAVVKEGNLAPYVDLAYFCRPSVRETSFLKNVQASFESLIKEISQKKEFEEHIKSKLALEPEVWQDLLKKEALLAIAIIRYARFREMAFDQETLPEMDSRIEMDDWLILLEDYSLNRLKLSENESDHAELARIRAILKTFGFVVTESGIRQQRSPGDIILSLSESKDAATVKILEKEKEVMGKFLRAIVICDFEKNSAMVKSELSGILDKDAGSAVRTFKTIASAKETGDLDPVLVTGSGVLCDGDRIDELMEKGNLWLSKNKHKIRLKKAKTAYPNIIELSGDGPGWASRVYVRMMTSLFEQGVTRCLIGTRGIFGEGWDSLSLNTLIDLTTATTSVTVNQIRGRSIRLDPNNKYKLAHNWDVVCVAQDFDGGDKDLKRLIRKHKHVYGLCGDKILKGINHIDKNLENSLKTLGYKKINLDLTNFWMMGRVNKRADDYNAWKIGEEYSNFEFSGTEIDRTDMKFATAFTLNESLKHIFWNIVYTFAAALGSYFFYFTSYAASLGSLIFFLFFAIAVSIILSMKNMLKYFKRAFLDNPVDSYLKDIGKAILLSLKENKLIDNGISTDNIRIVENKEKNYDVYIDYGTKQDVRLFSECFKEVLSPVRDQRYLVYRTDANISPSFYSPIWYIFRELFSVFRPDVYAYHPVPNIMSVNKERADCFAKYWKQYVGGGELVFTRSEQGSKVLLKERKKNKIKIRHMAFEMWR
ncbi:MAG: DEAD/DEAH box helicase family protein, partial [Nanoarchaeota archaeon]|nr:DEAD/DEAH box helicase family protein [Nanoarchaeota archaeon]